MSYDTISNGLSDAGSTLLGRAPRTGSVPQFTGDALAGVTDPGGLLGQIARLAAVVGAFSKGVGPGMQVLDMISKDDQRRGQQASYATANGMDVAEYEEFFGERPRGNVPTEMGAKDAAPGGPSLPDQHEMIKGFATPEDLVKARQSGMLRQQQSPDYMAGASPEQNAAQAALEQRMGLKSDYIRQNEALSDTMQKAGGFPPGQYESSTQIAPGGEMGFRASSLPPMDRSIPREIFDNIKAPVGWEKFAVDDPAAPGMVHWKMVNIKSGRDLFDLLGEAYPGDPQAQMQALAGIRGAASKSPKGAEEAARKFEKDHNLTLSTDQRVKFLGTWNTEAQASAADRTKGGADMMLPRGQLMQQTMQEILIEQGLIKSPADLEALKEQETTFKNMFPDESQGARPTPGPVITPKTEKTPGGGQPTSMATPSVSQTPNPQPAGQAGPPAKRKAGVLLNNLSGAANKVIRTLKESGPQIAGLELAEALNGTALDKEGREVLLRSLWEELKNVSETDKALILRALKERLVNE